MSTSRSLTNTDAVQERIAAKIDPAVTGGLAISSQGGGLAFADVGQVMEFGKLMSVAGVAVRPHLRGNPGACVAICIQAIEWRMSPYAVANKSYLVNDQIAYEAQLLHAVVLQRAPIKGRVKVEYTGEGAARVCRVWAELSDEPGEIVDYSSPEFAKITPKNSPLWKSDPDQQQFYYSVRALARRHFPDVILGVYAEDELPANPHQGPDRAKDVTPPRPGLTAALDRIAGEPAAPADEIEHDEPGADQVDEPAGDDPEDDPDYDNSGNLRAGVDHDLDDPEDDAPAGDEGDGDGDAPREQSPVDVAYDRGWAARERGMARKALPPELRDDARRAEADAWHAGYDECAQKQQGRS